jgi:hypothetical protein
MLCYDQFDIWNPWSETRASLSNRTIFTVRGATSSTFLSKLYHKSHDISSLHVNHRKLLVKLTLNMPKINARADSRVDKAIVALTKYPNMTIPEAMKLAGFTPPEILCKAKYMWVYRRAEKILNRSKAFLTPPTTRCVEVLSGVSMSTLSESVTSPPSPPVASPPNKVKRTRWPAAASQACHAQKLHKKQQYNKAFKHATIAYAREKAKGKSGMSARMVTEIVRNEFKVNLCPQTIQKKVKDGAVGFSPLRRGPKGFIPEHHFNNLCIAFETFIRINQMNGNT